MQSTLAHSLGLVFQLDAIDYDRANFLNSDLSIEQIQGIMGGSQPRARRSRTREQCHFRHAPANHGRQFVSWLAL